MGIYAQRNFSKQVRKHGIMNTFQLRSMNAIHIDIDMIMLQILDLKDNKLLHISKAAFIGLGKLKYLRLQNNHLRELHIEVFRPLFNVNTIEVHNNQIKHVFNKHAFNLRKKGSRSAIMLSGIKPK